MRRILEAVVLMVSWGLGVDTVKAQYALENFSLDSTAQSWYDDHVGLANTALLNGEQFTFTRKSPNSHLFYESNTWLNMDIVYFGQSFSGIQAMYDLETDQLVVYNPLDPASPMILLKEQVSAFDIGNAHFERIEQVGFRTNEFYQVLYRGQQLALMYKVYKRLKITSGIFTYELSYDPLLKVNDEYRSFVRFGAIKRYFPEHKKELKRFKKGIALRGRLDRKDRQQKLSKLVAYCDQLMSK